MNPAAEEYQPVGHTSSGSSGRGGSKDELSAFVGTMQVHTLPFQIVGGKSCHLIGKL